MFCLMNLNLMLIDKLKKFIMIDMIQLKIMELQIMEPQRLQPQDLYYQKDMELELPGRMLKEELSPTDIVN